MTTVQELERIIKTDWEESITGRDTDVPEPNITREKEVTRARKRGQDLLVVRDGGPQDRSPAGVGYTEEDITTRVSIDLRTAESRERMFGQVDSTGASATDYSYYRWPGLVGETLRVILSHRRGLGVYDRITPSQVNDVSGNYGNDNWRVTVEVTARSFASGLDTST